MGFRVRLVLWLGLVLGLGVNVRVRVWFEGLGCWVRIKVRV